MLTTLCTNEQGQQQLSTAFGSLWRYGPTQRVYSVLTTTAGTDHTASVLCFAVWLTGSCAWAASLSAFDHSYCTPNCHAVKCHGRSRLLELEDGGPVDTGQCASPQGKVLQTHKDPCRLSW
jgi:hypothetical protein